MKKILLLLMFVFVVGCGASEPTPSEMIVGEWEGSAMNDDNSEAGVVDYDFREDGTVTFTANTIYVQNGRWEFNEDGNLCFDYGEDAKGCGSLEFFGEDAYSYTGLESGSKFDLTRVESE